MTQPYTPPIYPSGANSIEARVKALEVAKHYDAMHMAAMREDLEAAHERISKISKHRAADREHMEAIKGKILLYLVGALFSAVSALFLMVLKLKFPGLLP